MSKVWNSAHARTIQEASLPSWQGLRLPARSCRACNLQRLILLIPLKSFLQINQNIKKSKGLLTYVITYFFWLTLQIFKYVSVGQWINILSKPEHLISPPPRNVTRHDIPATDTSLCDFLDMDTQAPWNMGVLGWLILCTLIDRLIILGEGRKAQRNPYAPLPNDGKYTVD